MNLSIRPQLFGAGLALAAAVTIKRMLPKRPG